MTESRFAGLTPLFAPRSIAILGASNDPTRIGGRPIAHMKAAGIPGRDLSGKPEPDGGAGADGISIRRGAARGTGRGDRGRARRLLRWKRWRNSASAARRRRWCLRQALPRWMRTAKRRSRAWSQQRGRTACAYWVRTVWACSTGAESYYATFSTSFDSGWPVLGRIGIASQSGAYGTHLYTLARNRGIGASLCIMTGNELDVTVGECIGWLAENPEVDVIAAYIEGIREAPGLIAAFKAAHAARKPIVMMKVGGVRWERRRRGRTPRPSPAMTRSQKR